MPVLLLVGGPGKVLRRYGPEVVVSRHGIELFSTSSRQDVLSEWRVDVLRASYTVGLRLFEVHSRNEGIHFGVLARLLAIVAYRLHVIGITDKFAETCRFWLGQAARLGQIDEIAAVGVLRPEDTELIAIALDVDLWESGTRSRVRHAADLKYFSRDNDIEISRFALLLMLRIQVIRYARKFDSSSRLALGRIWRPSALAETERINRRFSAAYLVHAGVPAKQSYLRKSEALLLSGDLAGSAHALLPLFGSPKELHTSSAADFIRTLLDGLNDKSSTKRTKRVLARIAERAVAEDPAQFDHVERERFLDLLLESWILGFNRVEADARIVAEEMDVEFNVDSLAFDEYVTYTANIPLDIPTLQVVVALWPLSGALDSIAASSIADRWEAFYSRTGNPRDIAFAMAYRMVSYRSEIASSTESAESAVRALVTASSYMQETHEPLIDLPRIIDSVERLVPRSHRLRADVTQLLGACATQCAVMGLSVPRMTDLSVRYSLERLRYARSARHHEVVELADALQNAAIALCHRVRLKTSTRATKRDLDRAVKYSLAAYRDVGDHGSTRVLLTYSWVLNLRSELLGSDDRALALILQRSALQSFRADESPTRDAMSASVFELLIPFSDDYESEDIALALFVARRAAIDYRISTSDALGAAAEAAQFAFKIGAWHDVLEFSRLGLDRAIAATNVLLRGKSPERFVALVGGLGALGAVAACRLGDPESAVNLLERSAAQSSVHSAPDSQLVGLAVARNFCSRNGTPIIYLACTPELGLALVINADKTIELVELSGLSSNRVLSMREQLTPTGGDDSHNSEVHHRAVAGAAIPSPARVNSVLSELTDILQQIEFPNSDFIHLVPVGACASLPWPAAIADLLPERTGVTVSPSATLLVDSAGRAFRDAAGFAITAPWPTRFHGKSYEDLPGAIAEGQMLEALHGAHSFTGPEANRSNFDLALSSPCSFVHIAAHCHFDSTDWAGARLLWSTEGNVDSSTTAAAEIGRVNASLVFLACCSAGAPGGGAPDEVVGFPTSLLASGALNVVGPLWPVEDSVTFGIVSAFYRQWLVEGHPPSIALRLACNEVRFNPAFSESSAWAAFVVFGAAKPRSTVVGR